MNQIHTSLILVVGVLIAGVAGCGDDGGSSVSQGPGGESTNSPKTWAELVEWTKSNNFGAYTNEGVITDRRKLNNPTKIKVISVAGSSLSDVRPFAEATELRDLYLQNTPISDLSPLAKLKQLELIDIRDTRVTDLTPLHKLPKLKKVAVRGTPVSQEQIAKLREALPKIDVYGKPSTR